MTSKLEKYNEKRDFQKSGEPEGLAQEPGLRLRFAVQHHMARRDHYDLRLEWDGVLLSFAVPKGPSYNPKDKRLAVHVEDHPLEYRSFEGTIPKGEYGGGTMMLWDEGTWEPYGDVDEGLAEGAIKFILHGRRLRGKWALVHLKPKEGEKNDNWLLLKEKDEHAKDSAGILEFDTSVRTSRTMQQIAEGKEAVVHSVKNPFGMAEVQLAKVVSAVPERDDWLFELKYDGYRIMAYVEGGDVKLISRNGNEFTDRFAQVAQSLLDWSDGRSMVLDGEMAITDEAGKTDFQALQNYMKKPGGKNLTYIVFDLLALDGEDLRGRRLIERKQTLESLLKGAPKNLYFSRHISGNGEKSLEAACEAGMEGIVGKRADSVYSGTRNGDWVKLKCDTRQEFVIGGYTRTDKKPEGLSALLLGAYEGRELVYAGRAGTGFTEKTAKELLQRFDGLKRETSPFLIAPRPKSNEAFTWLWPELVAEIKFAEWTEENQLRQASFKGLRADKDPRDVKRESVSSDEEADEVPYDNGKLEKSMNVNEKILTVDEIKISSPDKVIFEDPPITKADVVRYYKQVAKRMLPYVANRILSIVRCPKGIAGACFYKKHPGPDNKQIVRMPVETNGGEEEFYFYIENAAGLIYEVQMGTLEFHTWGSRVENLEKPDVMVFDLDPDEGMELERIRQGVLDIKSVLDQLRLTSFLKTSGGKGYHVVVPIKPSVEWDAFHAFARRIAEVMEQQWPERYTSNVRKDKRKGKIFIDWIRNGRGATSIAPYSVRARKGAAVSMPIGWEELSLVAPDGVKMADALKRIQKKDPWAEFYKIDQKLK